MMGDACAELEVVTEDADIGTVGAEVMVGRNSVRTRDIPRLRFKEDVLCGYGDI